MPGLAYGQVSLKVLQSEYKETNKQYFNNKLPSVKIVFIKNLLASDKEPSMASTWCNPQGFNCDIEIDPDKNKINRVMMMTLYHEECHIFLWVKKIDHGREFQSCMLRLAEQGAFEDYW